MAGQSKGSYISLSLTEIQRESEKHRKIEREKQERRAEGLGERRPTTTRLCGSSS